MAVTMDDVARRVGVAKSTVSLVLNNKPGVSLELREAILQAATELGYRLPQRRNQKQSAESKSIVVIHGEDELSGAGPTVLFLTYLEGIRAYLDDFNVNFSLFANYREEPDNLVLRLLNHDNLSPDGFILMGLVAKRSGVLVHQILEQNIPLVVLGRNWPDLPVSTVSQDHTQQVCIALDHLIQLGHRKIGFVAREIDQQYDWFDWRLSCYKCKMQELKGTVDEDCIALGRDGCEATRVLLSRRPDITAIFAINDARAVEVLQELRALGRRVPQDISVVGVDDAIRSPDGCPALTTVAFPHFEIGYLGAELLLKQIEDDALYYANVLVNSMLIERESCTAPYN